MEIVLCDVAGRETVQQRETMNDNARHFSQLSTLIGIKSYRTTNDRIIEYLFCYAFYVRKIFSPLLLVISTSYTQLVAVVLHCYTMCQSTLFTESCSSGQCATPKTQLIHLEFFWCLLVVLWLISYYRVITTLRVNCTLQVLLLISALFHS